MIDVLKKVAKKEKKMKERNSTAVGGSKA